MNNLLNNLLKSIDAFIKIRYQYIYTKLQLDKNIIQILPKISFASVTNDGTIILNNESWKKKC